MAQELEHISVPQPFDSENTVEWVHRFNNCAKANRWNDNSEATNSVERQSTSSLARLNRRTARWLFCDCRGTKEEASLVRVLITGSVSHAEVATWRSTITFRTRFKAKTTTTVCAFLLPYETANAEILKLFHGLHSAEKQVYVHII